MMKRTPFPPVFWVANLIEVLERFAYYGIYFGFGIYMTSLGYSRDQLGIIQSLFLLLSYMVPVVSGSFGDRYGFKKVLIVSYLAYLPSILLLMLTRSFSGIALTMLSIGLAAGIFKPLIAGTVRVTSDSTNKTLGFGIYYAMVNVGGSFGPIVAGRLRAISWNYAFAAAGVTMAIMLVITLLFYKEPPREATGETLGQRLRGIGTALGDMKFSAFLVILGLFFWLPFWSFFNLCALYVDSNVDTARLYESMRAVLGTGVAGFFSHVDEHGVRRVLGETISHTGCRQPGAGVPRHPGVRARRDDHLAAAAGVHHLDRAQGEGRSVHGIELPGDRHRRSDQRRDLHHALRPLRRARHAGIRVVRDGRALRRGGRRPVAVRQGGRRVPGADGVRFSNPLDSFRP
jgi:POT family proton-dependent oligopeptide transporter